MENKRISNLYNFKSFGVKLLDVSENDRKVKIYLSAFNIVDSDKDIIMKGAFAKSINERGPASNSNRQIAFLRMHDWTKQIGKFTELKEDDYGLMGVAQLGKSTQGQDALYDYQDGIIREHSIGFKYIADKMKYNEVDNTYIVSEVELWEGSAVTFGANSETFVVDVSKGQNKSSYLKTLNDEMTILLKSLREGKGTDERLYAIEMGLNVIQSKYNKLVTYEPQDVKYCTHCNDKKQPTKDATVLEEQAKKRILLSKF